MKIRSFVLIASIGLAMSHCDSNEEKCFPNTKTLCREGTTFWIDSCGYEGNVAGNCVCGCNADFSACKEPCECTPDCDSKECGPNGCGGSCLPGCIGNDTCNTQTGMCECIPNCSGKCCGDDGCGGTCSDKCSDTDRTCNTNSCSCVGDCIPLDCSDLGYECGIWPNGCGNNVTCGSCSGQGEVCIEGTCCTPDCEGKECGADGCGGECFPGCAEYETCNVSGSCEGCQINIHCKENEVCNPITNECICVPDCAGKACGADGCGGECTPGCAENETCVGFGQCEKKCEAYYDCTPDMVCNPATMTCTTRECNDWDRRCNNDWTEICKNGLWNQVTHCQEPTQACVRGVCLVRSEKKMGQACRDSVECDTGWCLKSSDHVQGYCSIENCTGNTECINHSNDGAEMCCENFGSDSNVCLKIAVGFECGDGTGTCGSSCAGQLDSACDLSQVCLSNGVEDPNAICAHACTVPSDCDGCSLPNKPNVKFDCLPIQGGVTFCVPDWNDSCGSSNTCEDDLVCVAVPTVDMTELEGICTKQGKKPVGDSCNDNDDPNQLEFEDRCIGFYCIMGHCTEVCELSSDCTIENMVCGLINFRMDAAGNMASIGMCQWLDGSKQQCSGDVSCKDAGHPDEICSFYLTPKGDMNKVCTTENCDHNNDTDCAGPGEECGDGKATCYNGICLTNGNNSWCAALCDTHGDCAEYGMICGEHRLEGIDVILDTCVVEP